MKKPVVVPFGLLTSDVMARHVRRRGFEDGTLLTYWQKIVPSHLVRWTVPKRMRRVRGKNELMVGVVPAKITEVQYFREMLRDDINRFFCFVMVDSVVFVADEDLSSSF